MDVLDRHNGSRLKVLIGDGRSLCKVMRASMTAVGLALEIYIDSYGIQPNTTYEYCVVEGTPSGVERHSG